MISIRTYWFSYEVILFYSWSPGILKHHVICWSPGMQKAQHQVDLQLVTSGELLLMLLQMVHQTLMGTRDTEQMVTADAIVTLLKMVMWVLILVLADVLLLTDCHRHHPRPVLDIDFRLDYMKQWLIHSYRGGHLLLFVELPSSTDVIVIL